MTERVEALKRLAGVPPEQLLADLKAARQRTLEWVATLTDEDLDRVSRHPALGEVNLETFITAIYGHQLMHMRDLMDTLGGIGMEELKRRILAEGRDLGNGILKVDGFINHQIDQGLMQRAGEELARRFRGVGASKILTAEISGIAPALATGLALGIPVIYARKRKPITMIEPVYVESAPSHTKGLEVLLMVSPEYLGPGDRVLIIDDFLATGLTIAALVRLVQKAGGEVVGIGVLIEKQFEGGRDVLASLGVPIEALVTITEMRDGRIIIAD